MNIFNGITNQCSLTKITVSNFFRLIRIPSNPNENLIEISEDAIRQYFEKTFQITREDSFQDFLCHQDGIEFIFKPKFADFNFFQFRLTFDIKLFSVVLTSEQQFLEFGISNIRLKPLNYFSKLCRFYIQIKVRKLVVSELERICREQQIEFERLFFSADERLIYKIHLINVKELDKLREPYFIMGNRSFLDLIRVTSVQHREQAILIHYQMRNC